MVLKSLDLLPGELRQLLEAAGVDSGSEVKPPDFLRDSLSQPADAARTPPALLEEADIEPSELAACLWVLARPSRVLEFRRVARRRLLDRGWACFSTARPQAAALLQQEDGTSTLLVFDSAQGWIDWIMEGLVHLSLPDVPLLEIPPVPADTWLVIAALCDEFLARYAVPEEDWQPSDPISFNLDGLAARLHSPARPNDSWLAGFRSVTGDASVPPTLEDLELILESLSNERLLVQESPTSGAARYGISRRLTWLVRTLAWWDRGFWIGSPDDLDRYQLVVQATGLWALRKGVTPDGISMFKLDAVAGEELGLALGQRVSLREPGRSSLRFSRDLSGPATEPPAAPPPVPTAASCTGCGQSLRPDARFCPNCGHPVGSASARRSE